MPDLRLAKARRTLPEGYQFGDAGEYDAHICCPCLFDPLELVMRCHICQAPHPLVFSALDKRLMEQYLAK